MRKVAILVLLVIFTFAIQGVNFTPILAQIYNWDATPFNEPTWVKNDISNAWNDDLERNIDNELNYNDFGVSTKIPGVEGAFAVIY